METSYSLLGLTELTDKLALRASTVEGRIVSASSVPVDTLEEAEKLLDETSAMIDLLINHPEIYIDPVEDLRPTITKAVKSQSLTGSEIWPFVYLLNGAERIIHAFASAGVGPGSPLFVDLPHIQGLADLIEESLNEEGSVKTDATPAIERLHHSINSLKKNIRGEAERLLSSKEIAPMLQENYVTVRDNRFAIPVKAEHKNHIEGIIHDSSNSGQTFFIEPKELVQLNNRLRTAEMELEDEVAKLLRYLTKSIADEADPLGEIYKGIIRLDVILARARLSSDINGVRPVFGDELFIKSASNPQLLLENKPVVKNDISIPAGKRVLIISGPNAGGKTVALKAVGALSLMSRSGLFICADEGSVMPFYDRVEADIGDSQSIHDDLSTFSAHVVRINSILKSAGKGSLVLLDELMVSTDPKEGSALAVAALDKLVSLGADVIVTTHFHDLKILAQSQDMFHNASMEFDKFEGRPTYRMISGTPGSSSAIEMAERLGMDKDLLEAARKFHQGGDERIERALAELRDQRILLERDRAEARKAKEESVRLREELNRMKAEIEERNEEIKRTARRKISADVAVARQELSDLVKEAKAARGDQKALKEKVTEVGRIAEESAWASAPDEQISRNNLKPGDQVYVVAMGKTGRLESVSGDSKAEVSFGAMRVTVGLGDIVGVGKEKKPGKVRSSEPARRPEPIVSDEFMEEVHLRGMRAEEALDLLERFLDSMLRREVDSVRIVHGKGTGVLRTVVRELLSSSPYVKNFRQGEAREGGEGVTIATLRY